MVRTLCDRVVVMRQGRIVEVDAVFRHPRQDYTRTLLDSVPRLP